MQQHTQPSSLSPVPEPTVGQSESLSASGGTKVWPANHVLVNGQVRYALHGKALWNSLNGQWPEQHWKPQFTVMSYPKLALL